MFKIFIVLSTLTIINELTSTLNLKAPRGEFVF
jgi:hypothetical protein